MISNERTVLERATRVMTIALAAMPLLGMRTMVFAIVGWIVLLAIRLTITRTLPTPDWRTCIILCAPFLLMLLDLLRSDGDHSSWKLVERSAALIIFPIGFLLIGAPADQRIRDRSLDVFSVAALILAVIINAMVIPLTADRANGFAVLYRARFSGISGIHPPYAAYWFLAAALFQGYRLFTHSQEKRWQLGLRMTIAVGCTAAGMVIGSRMPVAAFVVAFVVMLFAQLRRSLAIGSTIVVGLGFVAALFFFPGLHERVLELRAGSTTMPRPNELTSVNIRTPITQCTFQLLEDNWLLGMGQQRTQRALDVCYESLELPLMKEQGYGPHDQLLHWWLAFGIAGLAAFVLLFGWSLRHAWQRSDVLHLAFLIFLILCCFTEDLLTRQWGVVLFAYFNTLLIASRKTPLSTVR